MDNLLLNSYYIKFHSKQVEDWLTKIEIINEKYIDRVAFHDSIIKIIMNKIYDIGFKSILIDFHNSFDYLDELDEKINLLNYIQKDNLQENRIISSKIHFAINNTLNYIAEILNHYMDDYMQIKNTFNTRNTKITSIQLNEGDTHNNGKSVAKIFFNEEVIVYKPKDLGPDIFYYKVIEFFNKKTKNDLYIPKCINKQIYGWQEFIKYSKSTCIRDINNYYKELGIHSCFLYLFQATDIHFENIISNNRHPVFIDLETIFQSDFNYNNFSEDNFNYNFIMDTILGTFLFDFSASPLENMFLFIGGTTNPIRQTYNKEVLVDINSDKMRFINSIHKNSDISNIPLLNNSYQEIYDYIGDYSDGFLECYNFILHNKDFLKQFIMETTNFSIRYVLRPTYVYAKFIDALKDPNRLIGNKQSNLFEILNKSNADIIQKDTILELEFLDIQSYDIPLFNSSLDSKSLFHSKSGTKIDQFLLKDPRSKVLDKLHNLSEKDCNYQLELINMAISSYYENAENHIRKNPNTKQNFKINKSNKEILRRELSIIKDKLKVNHDYIQALSLRHDQRGNNVLSTMPMGIYDGLAGLGLLLAAEQKVLGNKNENEIKKINNTINMLYKSDIRNNLFSIYHGKSSYFKYYLELNRINKFSTINLKDSLIDFCNEVLQSDISRAPLDYIGGISGLLSLLIEFKKEINDNILDDCILFLMNTIISRLKTEDNLLFWSSDNEDSVTLSGFSHGITGINYSLSKVIHFYPDLKDELTDIIHKTSLYEDRLFNNNSFCWMDNRESNGATSSNTWCNGNSGILLGRRFIVQNTGLPLNYINETESLVLKEKLLHEIDHSICHGLAGNLIILNKLNNHNIPPQLNEIRNSLYSALSTQSIKSGYIYNTNTLSFFLGNVGILYSLLHDIDHTLPPILI